MNKKVNVFVIPEPDLTKMLVNAFRLGCEAGNQSYNIGIDELTDKYEKSLVNSLRILRVHCAKEVEVNE